MGVRRPDEHHRHACKRVVVRSSQVMKPRKQLGEFGTTVFNDEHGVLNPLTADVDRIYTRIKRRKLQRIEEIENILAPLLNEHPEVGRVLEIICGWKPAFSTLQEDDIESGNIL